MTFKEETLKRMFAPNQRKIVQIHSYASVQSDGVVVLCDDGSLFEYVTKGAKEKHTGKWRVFPNIPQPDAPLGSFFRYGEDE